MKPEVIEKLQQFSKTWAELRRKHRLVTEEIQANQRAFNAWMQQEFKLSEKDATEIHVSDLLLKAVGHDQAS